MGFKISSAASAMAGRSLQSLVKRAPVLGLGSPSFLRHGGPSPNHPRFLSSSNGSGVDGRVAVCKFGGTSVATVQSISEILRLLDMDSDRRYVIVSAPGKRFAEDIKVTDLLYQCHTLAAERDASYSSFFDENIADRFRHLTQHLAPSSDGVQLDADLEAAKGKIADLARAGQPPDFAASRGEALCGRMFADVVGWEFIDPAGGEFIQFGADGTYDEVKTASAVAATLAHIPRAVVPGFYGSSLKDPSGVQTFSRGGSDVTGAIVAAGAAAATGNEETEVVYENWTDVDGVFNADPRVVPDARSIPFLSFSELHTLAAAGAGVLHPDAVAPCKAVGVPINVKNTRNPVHPGTMMVADGDPRASQWDQAALAIGVTGKIDESMQQGLVNIVLTGALSTNCKAVKIATDLHRFGAIFLLFIC
eukprot:SAG31_NODE_950_length_10811_cov_4.497760_2_plen_420_part_00